MRHWKVIGARTVRYVCYVDAEDEDKAMELAETESWQIDDEAMEMNEIPPDIYEVEEIYG